MIQSSPQFVKNFYILILFSFCLFSYIYCDICAERGIDIRKNLLDARVKDLYFATEDQQDIYILTEVGTVYRSIDGGKTFLNKMSFFPQWDNETIAYHGETGVHHIRGSGKGGVVYFEGNGLAYWVTRGGDEYKLYQLGTFNSETSQISGEYLYKLYPHPTEPSTVLRMVYNSNCFATNYVNCSIRSEVSMYEGADNSWQLVNNYTFKAKWGIGDDRIVFLSMDEENRPSNQLSVSPFDSNKNLEVVSNYGTTSEAKVPSVVDFEVANNVVYFVKYILEEDKLIAYITTDISSANEMKFGGAGNITGISFYILETSPDVSFIGVQSSNDNTYGNLFQGSYTDANYWISLSNLRMNAFGADFYKTNDLPGTYIANNYDSDSVDENHVQTRISFDKGGLWLSLKLLTGLSNVNLFITSEFTNQKILSTEQAVGILYALGNEGDYRKTIEEDVGLYLSRSGGLSWERVLDGLHHFSYNDHASLIVAFTSGEPISTLKFSWDQGITWDNCTWGSLESDQFYVKDVFALANYPNGLQFIVTGQFDSSGGMVMSIDFIDSGMRICNESDDYEIFEPTTGGFCVLGQSTSYLRRKRNVSCISPGVEQQELDTYSCECTRMDFQCDGNCFEERQVDGQLNTVCVNTCVGQENDPMLPPADCQGKYLQTQGYTKIPGDMCVGGSDYGPILQDCPSTDETITSSPIPSPSISNAPSLTDQSPSSSSLPSPSISDSGSSSESSSPLQSPSQSPSSSISDSGSSSESSSPLQSPSQSPSSSISDSGSPSEELSSKSNTPTRTTTLTKQSPSFVVKPSEDSYTMYSSNSTESQPDTEASKLPLTLIIAGSAIFGIVGVMVMLCVGVIIVIIRKKKTSSSSLKTKYDDDVFSLEDNDEWEL